MNSLAFIRDAKSLITQIKQSGNDATANTQIQQQLDQLFSGMTNPSLPSAKRLAETALWHKFNVDSRVIHRVNQF